jgi:hypothetical protein
MPILILYNPVHPRGLVLDRRVLIGRRPFNTVMIADPAVSRIHAWIGRQDGAYLLHDAGSRAGTMLNDQPLESPRLLADGDEIRIGPATLVYMEGDKLPADVEPLHPPDAPPAADPYDGGIYFDCTCGGPMWVSRDLAGATGRCRYCGERLVVPHVSGTTARPLAPAGLVDAPVRRQPPRPKQAPAPPIEAAAITATTATTAAAAAAAAAPPPPPRTAPAVSPPPAAKAPANVATEVGTCSICQADIQVGEEQTQCPSCHLTFHAQCWEENYGCSAYGCDQVNILAPPPSEAPADNGAPPAVDPNLTPEALLATEHPFPWDIVLLALSFVALGLSAISFGAPSVILLLAALIYLVRGKAQRKVLVVCAVLIGLAGIAAGYATSMLMWKGVRVWEKFLK